MNDSYSILIIEDEKNILDFMSKTLKSNGYKTTTTDSGKAALAIINSGCPDLILLDLGLPDMDGNEIISSVRKWTSCPIIVISARTGEHDKVTALDLGADDYISKPFRPRELISRINSVLRRYGNSSSLLEYQGLSADTTKGTVSKNGTEIILSALEYRLLLLFLNNQGIILSRSRLLDELWDIAGEFVNDNTLTVYIKRLREKIEDDPQNPIYIKTIRGMGYKMGV